MVRATEKYLTEVRRRWQWNAPRLFARDGTGNFPHGGNDIKHNPTLRHTLEAIADNYIPLCARKAELLDRKDDIETRDYPPPEERDEELRQYERIRKELAELDVDLIHVNKHALEMLAAEGSGFAAEVQRHLDPGQAPTEQFSKRLAKDLVGSLVGTLVQSCKSHIRGSTQNFIPRNFA